MAFYYQILQKIFFPVNIYPFRIHEIISQSGIPILMESSMLELFFFSTSTTRPSPISNGKQQRHYSIVNIRIRSSPLVSPFIDLISENRHIIDCRPMQRGYFWFNYGCIYVRLTPKPYITFSQVIYIQR